MFCSKCGGTNDDAAKFCHKCGNALALAGANGQATPPPAGGTTRGQPAQAGAKQFATGKNAAVALILSLIIIGVGQFYNGDIKKGLVMLAGAIVLGVATGGLAILAFWIWSGYDAYQVANGKSALW